uniref:Uncharacterized protein n=1 Tax=Triticum urartu TaxID=4572 RepID=A0A8R7UWY7_TRIUA
MLWFLQQFGICNIQYLAITSGSTGITLPRKIVSTRTRYSYVDSFISHRLEFIEAMRSCARHLNLKPSANWRKATNARGNAIRLWFYLYLWLHNKLWRDAAAHVCVIYLE